MSPSNTDRLIIIPWRHGTHDKVWDTTTTTPLRKVEVEEEVEDTVEVEVEVWRSRRSRMSRRRGGMKGAPENSCTNSYAVTTNTYLSPFLRYMPTDHGVSLCSSLKSQLRVGMTPRYFTGFLIPCMATTYILFMSHMHALLDLQHGSNSLVKLADLLVGQGRNTNWLWAQYRNVAMIFFQNFLYDYYSAHLHLQLSYFKFIL